MAMVTATAMLQPCTLSRPVAAFRSSFKGIALHNASLAFSRLSLKSQPVLQAPAKLPVQPVAHTGYKLKSHKASAKRFSVTGSGRIMRRQAYKQHLLRKKNTKRRNRLTGKVGVDLCDYANVIGALPYLKVSR